MAFESDTEARRVIGPALASIVVGAILGGAAVMGVAAVSAHNTIPDNDQVNSQDALLGGAEYGSRQ